MSEQRNKLTEQEPKKKPIALAVTLLLLTISLLFVILFSAKNIAYKQEIQVATGNNIVEHFKQLDRKLTVLQSNLTLLIEKAESWDEAASLTSGYSQFLLQDIHDHINELYVLGDKIKKDYFGAEQAQQLTAWHKAQDELIGKLSVNKELVNEDYLKLKLLQNQIDQLHKTVAQFNFKMEGNKNAMIRLSSGFDWMEIAEQFNQATIVEQAK